MNQKCYVQHVSGHGEKWEVDSSRTYADDTDYCVRAKLQNTRSKLHWLPKSEYVVCEPPEEWREVPVQIVEHSVTHDTRDQGGVYDGAKKLAQLMCGGTHRIKTLIVERKVQP